MAGKRRARALEELAAEAASCQACDLWRRATQTVFGAGSPTAKIFLIGEQPGDKEDLAGTPFVGPAGRVLDQSLEDAGIPASRVYVTNAVKHFKWKERGKRRLHQRPNQSEVAACSRWLRAELALVEPEVLVVLGATAGQALFGPSFRVSAARDRVLDFEGIPAVATNHPSAILRADPDTRDAMRAALVADLRRATRLAQIHDEGGDTEREPPRSGEKAAMHKVSSPDRKEKRE